MSELITLRKKKASKFYAVDLRVIELGNKEMSWAAKGVWTYLVSRPDGWQVNRADLLSKGSEKDFALRGILKELQEFGLLKIERGHVKDGKFGPSIWTVSEEFDFPQAEEPQAGQPQVGKPHVVNQHDLISTLNVQKTLLKNTNVQKNENVSEELTVTDAFALDSDPAFAFFAEKDFEQTEQPAILPQSDPLPKQPERKAIAGHPNQELLARLTVIPTVDIAQAKGLLVSYGEERVTAQLSYLAYRKADNPAATLRASLRNDWEAPPEYLKQSQLDAQKQEMARQAEALEAQWKLKLQASKARREEEQRQRKAEEDRWNALTPEQQQAEREAKALAHKSWLERRKATNPLTAMRERIYANCFGGAGK